MGVLPIRSRLTIRITTRNMKPHRRIDGHAKEFVRTLKPSRQDMASPHSIRGVRPKLKMTVYLLKFTPFFSGFSHLA